MVIRKLPLIRKVVGVGKARAVVLPAEWLRWIKEKYGEDIKFVELEVNDELRIKPHVPR